MAEYVSVGTVVCIHETDLALLVEGLEDDEVWVPRSVVSEDSEVVQDGDSGDLWVAEWFAMERGYV